MSFVVAIDGPAAAGKGTIARAVSTKFKLAHLDTGLLYRAVGHRVRNGEDAISAARSLTSKDLKADGLRSVEVAQFASKVAAIPDVRDALLHFQIQFAAQENGAVLDGRDIGTVICPDADVKLFVTASAKARAERRFLEMSPSDPQLTRARVEQAVIERDQRDASRDVAPMVPASDAVLIDTTDLSIEDALAEAIKIVAQKRNP